MPLLEERVRLAMPSSMLNLSDIAAYSGTLHAPTSHGGNASLTFRVLL
jgi:hypothetical protein